MLNPMVRYTGHMYKLFTVTALAACALLAGCHSPFVSATLSNHSNAAVHVPQVEYPSASFGTTTLSAGADFHYRFKILGSGPIKITFTDAHNQDHTLSGPELHEGQEGSLQITIEPDNTVDWKPSLEPRS